MSKHTTEVAAGDGANAADKADRSLVPQDLRWDFPMGSIHTFQMMSPQGIHREKHVAVHVRYAVYFNFKFSLSDPGIRCELASQFGCCIGMRI